MESFPYRVVTSFRRPGRHAPDPASTRFFAPLTTSPGLAPKCSGPSCPATVPLSGSLDLSAVSWHVRALRPCFMPLPPVGFSLQSIAPRKDRVRLSASLAPLQFSTTVPEVRCASPRPPGFTRRPRSWRGGLTPPEARTSFPSLSSTRLGARSARLRTLSRTGLRRLPRRPGTHAPGPPRSGGFRCFEAFLPPRVRAHGAPLSRTHRSRCSPGLCPSRALNPVEPRTLS